MSIPISHDRSSVKASVIIATYNYGKFLPMAIKSVFEQTFRNWELIIVDDGSTDKTSETIGPYLSDKRVRYIFQSNRGLPAARNTGIKASSGEFLQFLDADDLIHEKKLEIQSQYLENRKDVDVVISDYALFKDEDPKIQIKPLPRKSSGDIKADMLRGNFIVVNSSLSRKKAIDGIGGFDETLTSAEDWDLWLRMLLSGMVFESVEERLAFVRLHPSRMTKNRLNMYSGRYRVIKKNLRDVPKNSIYWRSAKGCYMRSKLALAREYLYRKKLGEAIKVIKEKPQHFDVRGAIDFLIETALNLRLQKDK